VYLVGWALMGKKKRRVIRAGKKARKAGKNFPQKKEKKKGKRA